VRLALALALVSAPPASPQGVAVGERVETGDTGLAGYEDIYGPPQSASLESLATFLGEMGFEPVRTTGQLQLNREGHFELREGIEGVLLVPVWEMERRDLLRFVGFRVEVVGLARELIEKQRRGDCIIDGQGALESQCRDWHLPPLPDRLGRPDWPRNSITFWSFSDATPFERAREPGGGLRIADVLAEPERYAGREVTLTGRFRGSNLFGDLPETTRRDGADWVIEQDGAAIWVTDAKPRGKGWQLDPGSKGESRWWIRVEGKLEVENGLAYIDADRLELRRKPD
jgi:hypothetical protein